MAIHKDKKTKPSQNQKTEIKSNRSLFDISQSMLDLGDILLAIEGDISDPEVALAIEHIFAFDKHDFDTKVDNYCALITEHEARVLIYKIEKQRLEYIVKQYTKSAEYLRKNLVHNFDRLGIDHYSTHRYPDIKIVNNGSVLPMGVDEGLVDSAGLLRDADKITDEDKETYFTRPWRLDTKTLRLALENGVNVLFARFGERGRRLDIGKTGKSIQLEKITEIEDIENQHG